MREVSVSHCHTDPFVVMRLLFMWTINLCFITLYVLNVPHLNLSVDKCVAGSHVLMFCSCIPWLCNVNIIIKCCWVSQQMKVWINRQSNRAIWPLRIKPKHDQTLMNKHFPQHEYFMSKSHTNKHTNESFPKSGDKTHHITKNKYLLCGVLYTN